MAFADLKNDFVFRRIFATHPDILRGLLNDLLDRHGNETIVAIEYLPSEQLPLVMGAKLSILDVRCKDQAGTTFVVEMQLIHIPGFINRVVYNACKAYVSQLKAAQKYTQLMDVVAISICDFELWPDAQQEQQQLPLVPMLSRWNLTEQKSGTPGLLQVQYAFLELPKLPVRKPEMGAAYWAWLFVHAPDLSEVPVDLPAGPYRDALELANQATFSEDGARRLSEGERMRSSKCAIWSTLSGPKARPKVGPRARPKARPKVGPRARPKARPRARPRARPKARPKARPRRCWLFSGRVVSPSAIRCACSHGGVPGRANA